MNEKMINEMKNERMTLTTRMRAHMDAFGDKIMDSDGIQTMKNMEVEFDKLNENINASERQLERERSMGESNAPAAKRTGKLDLFAKAMNGNIDAITEFRNNYTLSTDAEAGFLTAPVEFVADVIRGLDNNLFMRQISTIVPGVGQGQSLGFPYRKTEAADAEWTAEITALAEETTLDYGRREFKPNKLGRLIKLSKALANHASLAVPELQREIIYRIGIAQENAYMNGNGTAKPLGVFTASASGISTGRDVSTNNTATAVTFDGLMDAKYSIKGQYHPNLQWAAHRDFVKQVNKIKDGSGNYIWQPSVIAGQADRLLGHGVNMSEYAPNTFTTGLYVAVLGDFKNGYRITDSQDIAVQRLNELYAVNGQVGFLVDYYGDGMPVIEEAFARVKLG